MWGITFFLFKENDSSAIYSNLILENLLTLNLNMHTDNNNRLRKIFRRENNYLQIC